MLEHGERLLSTAPIGLRVSAVELDGELAHSLPTFAPIAHGSARNSP
jgi:hypothetical protein